MRRLILAATAVLGAASDAPAQTSYWNGNDLLRNCSLRPMTPEGLSLASQCQGYVLAVADMMGHFPLGGFRACVPVGTVPVSQLVDIATNHLRANADSRHLLAAGLVAQALSRAFPCP